VSLDGRTGALVSGLVGMIAVVLAAFVVMEPITYALHRWVMHGPAMAWHRSHHRNHHRRRHRRMRTSGRQPSLEANDLFPVVIGALVCVLFLVGYQVSSLSWLVPASVGITLYGLVYAVVHDGAIHGRFAVPAWVSRWSAPLAAAHELHHRFDDEPYGMLVPLVPDRISGKAAARPADRARPSSPATTEV
jgi:beta-carotene 3-hydroxylase